MTGKLKDKQQANNSLFPKTKTDPVEEPQDPAETIRKVSAGMQKLRASGLNRQAIVALLQDQTGCQKTDINRVLDGLGELARQYTK